MLLLTPNLVTIGTLLKVNCGKENPLRRFGKSLFKDDHLLSRYYVQIYSQTQLIKTWKKLNNNVTFSK